MGSSDAKLSKGLAKSRSHSNGNASSSCYGHGVVLTAGHLAGKRIVSVSRMHPGEDDIYEERELLGMGLQYE